MQGLGGGLLAGLGYAVINTALPESLWTKASALVSAMWGVGTVLGPGSGGLFAQYLSWRWAFWALVVFTVLIAILVPVALPGRYRPDPDLVRPRIPLWSLVILGAAAMVVSLAAVPHDGRAMGALLAVGAVLVAVFLFVDRRQTAAVLPPSTFRPGPLKWIYLTLGGLMAATMVVAGTGVGMAWPHLSAWAMSRVADPAEGPVAAAAINTVQLICGAFGAGLAGVVVNATAMSGAATARWAFAVFAVLAAAGLFASTRSVAMSGRTNAGRVPQP
ncbi:putative multidrug-efflux transporter [Mycolicibacterium hassiacum DSM 44199]|uniref:Putative multidrug-efflux transporter n=1 Tax=Mycolicibacterium hassiacum (strain DSM 44199 / CIP 105218 / JCM 12690 / 3849) TaxID=1122247 RepID=K5BB80_MYCHD|nr:putative multidrug-efflux transporter [Mycolicibacterium hassiacum DSM 44199]MDA4084761.1 multidrug transporter [Mycolicibacterium hassiacum DSM 44199]VCT89981.1 putative multidrug-efflux transporter [Mycolicibacterium hassiacum DSM 44199]